MPAMGVGAGGRCGRDADAVVFTKLMQEQNLRICNDSMQSCNALLKEMSLILDAGRKELPWFPLYSP
jgi:hypothetical protein